MSEGPGQSSAGQPPPPAPDLPGTGDSAAPGPGGPAGPEPEPDYALPPDPFRRGGAGPGDPDRPARPGPWGMTGPGGVSRRLAAAVAAVALASALIGGVVGGYLATRAAGGTTSPGYSLGPPPRAVPARSAGSVAGIAARVLPSVVMIRVDGAQGTGSGFVIRGGYIVTDNHVVTLDGTARSTAAPGRPSERPDRCRPASSAATPTPTSPSSSPPPPSACPPCRWATRPAWPSATR